MRIRIPPSKKAGCRTIRGQGLERRGHRGAVSAGDPWQCRLSTIQVWFCWVRRLLRQNRCKGRGDWVRQGTQAWWSTRSVDRERGRGEGNELLTHRLTGRDLLRSTSNPRIRLKIWLRSISQQITVWIDRSPISRDTHGR